MSKSSDNTPPVYRTSAVDPNFKYPVSPKENLLYRMQLMKDCAEDKSLARAYYNLCKNDIVFWIDTTAMTKDPRNVTTPVLPFICYDFQVPFIRTMKRYIRGGLGDIGVEKSKDMGVTWCVMYTYQHEFQFEPGADFRCGSRKEDFVDRIGVIDTLLEKMRFNLSYQPLFLMPAGFETNRQFKDNTTYMRLINKANQSSVVGESANRYFGSGGRSTSLFLDELALWEKGVDVDAWTATADQTPCRIAVSTPKGSSNKFAELMRGTTEKIHKITLHWTLHPDKNKGAYYLDGGLKILIDLSKDPEAAFKIWVNMGKRSKTVWSPWYEAEAARRTDADLAQEVDIDFHRSGSMFFNSQALAKQVAWEPYRRKTPDGGIPYGKFLRGNFVEVNDSVRFDEMENGPIRLFEFPKKEHQYTAGGDTAEGLLKGDKSAMVLQDKINYNTVCTVNTGLTPEDFAKQMQLAVWYFNEADCAPENNNHGYTTCQELRSKSHVKLYHTRRDEASGGQMETPKLGWSTTSKSRPEMLNTMAHLVEKSAIELRDPELIGQCATFIRNGDRGGKPEADGTALDDLVIACAIACKVTEEIPFKSKTNRQIDSRQREAVDKRLAMRKSGSGFKS